MADHPSIEGAWKGFVAKAVHPATSAWQISEMRAVFYSGALAAQVILGNAQADSSFDDAMTRMEAEFDAWEAEVQQRAHLADGPTAGRA